MGDIAVLYRLNREPVELKFAFERLTDCDGEPQEPIPYSLNCGTPFYSRDHVRYILDYLRFLFNPKARISFFNLFETVEKLGPKTKASRELFDLFAVSGYDFGVLETFSAPKACMSKFDALCAVIVRGREMLENGASISALIEYVWQAYFLPFMGSMYGSSKSLRDVKRLIGLSRVYTSLVRYLNDIAILVSEPDVSPNRVTISTVHRAKGCEWKYVFLASATNGIMPMRVKRRPFDDEHYKECFEEERRLMYVAITRARDVLDVSYLRHDGGSLSCYLQDFVCETDDCQ